MHERAIAHAPQSSSARDPVHFYRQYLPPFTGLRGGGGQRDACGLTLKLHYGTRTAKWAKIEFTMRFLVENYP